MDEQIRLQKFLSAAGVSSRRGAEELIAAGRVHVDGRQVTQMGVRVRPGHSRVDVDGMRVVAPSGHTYVMVNKPAGIVCTLADESGREDLAGLVSGYEQRLFHVGRLDVDTSGLLLMTDDGEVSHRLTHPSYEVTKTYLVLVRGSMSAHTVSRVRAGIELDDGVASVDRCIVKERFGGRSVVELDLHIGRNRIVRRLFDAIGHPVHELTRIGFGPLRLGGLASGHTRVLARDELAELFDSVGL